MRRGAWRAAVHGVAESDTTERRSTLCSIVTVLSLAETGHQVPPGVGSCVLLTVFFFLFKSVLFINFGYTDEFSRLFFGYKSGVTWSSLVAQTVKHLPVSAGAWAQSLGQEGPLEEEMAAHCRIPAWRILWTEETGGLQSMGSQRVGHD